ncbi:MAG: glycosyltransferase family 4 protein [Herpetosiphonaceae bacterium]|nr:glycosyltransferase family 4 protein [Herpetosiphonaceae bacterium]
MNVAVDARLLAYRVGGIAQYTQQLLQALSPVAPHDTFTVLAHRKQQKPIALGSNLVHRYLWTPPHNHWEQWSLPLELLLMRADVVHSPDFIPPLHLRKPLVITVHDLAFMRYPAILDAAARRFYGQIGAATRRADAIIAVSESTKRDLTELLDVPPERIDVVYEAAASRFEPLELAPNAKTFNGHILYAGSFALFVGTLEPRKNLPTLLHALARSRDRLPAALPKLVVAGPRGWLDEPIIAQVRDQKLGDYVYFIGSVDQHDLIWLYNACRFYVNPELYSGFGLPILEAMQCGAPVVAADTSALPEVVGDAGLLVPPLDVEAWADVLSRVWQDEALRNDLRARGFAQAQRFTWQQAAEETMAIYRRVRQ